VVVTGGTGRLGITEFGGLQVAAADAPRGTCTWTDWRQRRLAL